MPKQSKPTNSRNLHKTRKKKKEKSKEECNPQSIRNNYRKHFKTSPIKLAARETGTGHKEVEDQTNKQTLAPKK